MSGARPRAVVCGYAEMATIGLECLEEAGFTTLLFVTHEDSPGETIWWRPPAPWARERGIPVIAPLSLGAAEERERLAALAPDFLFSFYYRALIAPEILAVPGRGALNLHGSLLPRYRGRAPSNWVLVNGETETGVTLHYMDAKPDHGDIVMQRRVMIGFEDSAETLFWKLAGEARVLLREALPLLAAGRAPRAPQDHLLATYFGRRRPEDGRIDWGLSAVRVYNLVRAVTRPYPGAFTEVAGRKVFIWWGTPEKGRPERGPDPGVDRGPGSAPAPGTVVGPRGRGVGIATGSGLFVVLRAQMEGAEEALGADALAALFPAGRSLGA